MNKVFALILFILTLNTLSGQNIRYVRENGIGDGSSWLNASNDLQAMINLSLSGDEIWVAAGTYKPMHRIAATDVNGMATTDRDRAFLLKADIKIYGGFPPTGSPAKADRDWTTYTSRLSGDLNGNDMVSGSGTTLAFSNITENAYHVVVSTGNMGTAKLDGFTISGGNANVFSSVRLNSEVIARSAGGGLTCINASPTVTNSIFVSNTAPFGGGLYNYSASPDIMSCKFLGNITTAGVVFNNESSSPTLNQVTITANRCIDGGAFYSQSNSGPVVTNCVISDNTHHGIHTHGSSPVFNGVTISGNGREGVYSYVASPRLNNCTISANRRGGVSSNEGGITVITNCIISGNNESGVSSSFSSPQIINTVISGNGQHGISTINASVTARNVTIMGNAGSGLYNILASPTIYNSIIMGNSVGINTVSSNTFNTLTVQYSLVQNMAANSGNNNLDGSSVNAADLVLDYQPSTTGAPTTLGNYRLKQGSMVIDAGSNALNTSTEDPAGSPRILNDVIDLGAYEYDSALPVLFGEISAKITNNRLLINWETLTETNNKHFEIEVSTDGTSFKKLASISSKSNDGHSSLPLQYRYEINIPDSLQFTFSLGFLLLGFSFTNKKRKITFTMMLLSLILMISCAKQEAFDIPGSGKLFVRIIQVDKDGTATASKTVQASTNN